MREYEMCAILGYIKEKYPAVYQEAIDEVRE